MNYHARQQLIIASLVIAVVFDGIALLYGISAKLFWGYLSLIITLDGYAFYISQMYPPSGRTAVKPEPLSWLLFGFLTSTGWLVQVAQGGDAGSWTLGITAASCFVVAVWSYLRFEWTFDWFHAWTVSAALGLFIFSLITSRHAGLATFSAITATLADLVSYGPTFRKAWERPNEESATNFMFNSIKCLPALLALGNYTIATTIYLLMLLVVNGGFATFIVIRRMQQRA